MPRIPSAAGNLERRKETSEIKPPPPAERQIRAQPLCIPSAGHLRQMSHRAPGIFIRGPPIAGTDRAPPPCSTVPRGLGCAWTLKGGLCSPCPQRCHCHLQEEAPGEALGAMQGRGASPTCTLLAVGCFATFREELCAFLGSPTRTAMGHGHPNLQPTQAGRQRALTRSYLCVYGSPINQEP